MTTSSYRPPAPKALHDILTSDKDDESLRVYKEKLLGTNATAVVIGANHTLPQIHHSADASNPKNVLVRSLTLLAEGREPVTMSLENVADLENKSFTIKESCAYRLRVNFQVQREIVAGLKYVQKVSRHGINGEPCE